jgi:Flp pilus assembly CpaE family ATPase
VRPSTGTNVSGPTTDDPDTEIPRGTGQSEPETRAAEFGGEKKTMAKVISLFNHKGGVSKTTTTFHLGWKLARLGKKVLIVDADPQCNLTGLTLGLEDYDSLFSFYDSKQNTDIFRVRLRIAQCAIRRTSRLPMAA